MEDCPFCVVGNVFVEDCFFPIFVEVLVPAPVVVGCPVVVVCPVVVDCPVVVLIVPFVGTDGASHLLVALLLLAWL